MADMVMTSPSHSSGRFPCTGALGGAAAGLPPAQFTETVAKSGFDGAMATWKLLPGVKRQEGTKVRLQGLADEAGFTQNPLVMQMNKALYDGLPPDLKAVPVKAGGTCLVERRDRTDAGVAAMRFIDGPPGRVMESLAMILPAIPIFYPVVMGLDFHGMSSVDKPIWFGILALMVVATGHLRPRLGMNPFNIRRLARDTPIIETAKGVMPFRGVGPAAHRAVAAGAWHRPVAGAPQRLKAESENPP